MKPQKNRMQMGRNVMKLVIQKQTAEGEQIAIEGNIPEGILAQYASDPGAVSTFARPFFKLADDRLWEMNARLVAVHNRIKLLPEHLRPVVDLILQELHGMLYGQVSAADIREAVERDKQAIQEQMQKPEVAAEVANVEELANEALEDHEDA